MPGLRPQHILSAVAASRITGGEVSGASPGSMELVFRPGPVRHGEHSFDVSEKMPSAGSASLVFQTVALPLAFAPGRSSLTIKGGTHVEWSPPADYIKEVFLPSAFRMGFSADLHNPIMGYYPAGGGEIHSTIIPSREPLKALSVAERGPLVRVRVRSTVSNLPLSIATRQLKRVEARLEPLGLMIEKKKEEAPSPGKGSFVFISAEYENIVAGFSALGAIGKKAEAVGDEASDRFLSYFHKTGALDPHLSDQLAPLMALASGESRATVSEVTAHLTTNIRVIEEFLPVKFTLKGAGGEEGEVSVAGCAFKAP